LCCLLPIHREDAADLREELAGNLLYLVAFLGGEVWTRAGEKVEHHEFLLREMLAYMPRLLVRQCTAQLQQLQEELPRCSS
jgi:hypothetical protein